jgi:hypothetical protein
MFKEMLGEAFPIIEKFAPSIAAIVGSHASPPLLILNTLLLLAKVFNPVEEHFNIEDVKNWILLHPDCEELLKLAEPQVKELLHDLDTEVSAKN